jgi:hypothetical protein
MATASLPAVISATSSDYVSKAAPAWWLRANSYSVPVVALGQIAATWLVVRIVEGPSWLSNYEMVMAAMLGFIFAQCFLLGLWAALGGLSTVPRWLAVGVVYVAGAWALIHAAFGPDWQTMIDSAPEMLLMGGMLMAVCAALLLPLRRLAGWRIDFDAAYYPRPARRRGQVGMMDFAAMFCAVALPLSLCRVAMESDAENGAEIPMFMGLFALLVCATAAPVARAVLARRRKLLWLAGVAMWILAMAWGQSLLASLVPDLDLFDTAPNFIGLHWELLAFHAGIAVAVAVPLMALRLCGLKLLVVDGR